MKRMWSKNELKQQTDARVQALVEGGTLDNAKPLYYHPIYAIDATVGVIFSCVIINNSPTAYEWETFKAFLESETIFELCPMNGVMISDNNVKFDICRLQKYNDGKYYGYGHQMNGDIVNSVDCSNVIDSLFAEGHASQFSDFVNKIN